MSLPTPIDVQASLQTFSDGSYACEHRGLTLWKHQDDLDRLAAILDATKPTVVVETGTRWGGTAVWLADRGVDVITVDSDSPEVSEAARGLSDRVTYVQGDSVAPETVAEVRQLVRRRRTMVILDSEHAAPHVAQEIALYGPLVSPGCYLLVEDAIFDLATDPRLKSRGGFRIPAEGGPMVAIEQELASNDLWKRDTEIEALTPISHNPAGWWVKQGKRKGAPAGKAETP
ncbi:CmcI family methyltransferase [Plantactinospora solaniradicis]|uniref:CmcI family methyltransferase n=1 Tax=Plantactinospora solaniradicis TaxID=1723736 RepID=A0ABW1KQ69_9ACTN